MGEDKLKHFEVILQSVDRIQTELDDLKKWIDSQIFEDKMLKERNANPQRSTRTRKRKKNSAVLPQKKQNLDEEMQDSYVEVKREINDDEFGQDYDDTDDEGMSNSYPTTSSSKTKRNKFSLSQKQREDKEPGELEETSGGEEDESSNEVSHSKSRPRVLNNWILFKNVSIIEEFEEIDEWSIDFTRQLKSGQKSVTYYCKDGGRTCPAKLKFLYQSDNFGIDIFDNNNEHLHSEKRKEKNSGRQIPISQMSSINSEGGSIRRSRSKRSFIWEHFTKTEIDSKMKVVCNTCQKDYAFILGGGTGTFKKHLLKSHPELLFPVEPI